MFYITEKNIDYLIYGSLLFGTGGGIPEIYQRKILKKALEKNKKIPIRPIEEFKPNDFLGSIYGVGDPSSLKLKSNTLAIAIKKALKRYQKLSSIKIKGIIPGEIGGEALALYTSSVLNLPVVDSDLVGGRAAPAIYMDCFTLHKKNLTPFYGISANYKEIFLTGAFSGYEIETIFRFFLKENLGSGVIVGYPIKAKEYKKISAKNTLSKTIKAGLYLKEKKIKNLLNLIKGKIITEDKISLVKIKGEGDFTFGKIKIGKDYILKIQNENIILKKGRKIIAKAPDLICLIDKSTFRPIHNSKIKEFKNKNIILIKGDPPFYWKNKNFKNIWKNIISNLEKKL